MYSNLFYQSRVGDVTVKSRMKYDCEHMEFVNVRNQFKYLQHYYLGKFII